jgi:hypothetical protein
VQHPGPAPANTISATLAGRSRRIIDDEIARLADRAPTLTPADLRAIDQALDGLVTRLLIDRLQRCTDTPTLARLGMMFQAASHDTSPRDTTPRS